MPDSDLRQATKDALALVAEVDAEFRGSVTATLANLEKHLTAIDAKIELFDDRQRQQELCVKIIEKDLGQFRADITNARGDMASVKKALETHKSGNGMTSKEKAAVRVALIASIGSIIVAVVAAISAIF